MKIYSTSYGTTKESLKDPEITIIFDQKQKIYKFIMCA